MQDNQISIGAALVYTDELATVPVRITGRSDHPNSRGYWCAIVTMGRTDDHGADICAPAHFFTFRQPGTTYRNGYAAAQR